jgi:hypothetical protein
VTSHFCRHIARLGLSHHCKALMPVYFNCSVGYVIFVFSFGNVMYSNGAPFTNKEPDNMPSSLVAPKLVQTPATRPQEVHGVLLTGVMIFYPVRAWYRSSRHHMPCSLWGVDDLHIQVVRGQSSNSSPLIRTHEGFPSLMSSFVFVEPFSWDGWIPQNCYPTLAVLLNPSPLIRPFIPFQA